MKKPFKERKIQAICLGCNRTFHKTKKESYKKYCYKCWKAQNEQIWALDEEFNRKVNIE